MGLSFYKPKKYFIVQTEEGEVRGKVSTSSLTKKKYCSFLGIPYAKPPLGDLRFRPPQTPVVRRGVYDATFGRNHCHQRLLNIPIHFGSEDCLYLNVYTPKPPNEIITPLPIMLFIHGGGFHNGTGSKWVFSADFLLNRNIVVVTINYRLHALGFLNLGIEECPGNVGMKDQVFAMQWVQKNIQYFGGDPNNVTIFGQSAGSTSVHYHMISPLSQGLFHKAILQSGLCLSSWAFNENPTEKAFEIGREAGYYGNNRKELVTFLKKIPVKKLTIAVQKTWNKQLQTRGICISNLSPSVEAIVDGAFLPDTPEKLLKLMKPIPLICGVNSKEGFLAFTGIFGYVIPKLRKGFAICLRNTFAINSDLLPEISQKVKEIYFGKAPISPRTGNEIINFFSDIFNYRFYDAIDPVLKSKVPLYLYCFNYEGSLNYTVQYARMFHPWVNLKEKGAAHGDELPYLFIMPIRRFSSKIVGDDLKMIMYMTEMWTNFAKTGNPSTEEIQWEPTTLNELQYLGLNLRPRMIKGKIGGEKFEKLHQLLDPILEST